MTSESITAQDRIEKEVGNYILRGFDLEIDDYDSNGYPRKLSLYRITEGSFEESLQIDVINEIGEYYGYDKLDRRVVYDYTVDFNTGKKVEG